VSGSPRPAVFLDRDGTLIEDVHYISRAEDVRLLPGAGAAVRRLNEAGIPVVVVTNQSGIARGIVTPEAYEAVRARFEALLAAEGARLDATYHCPHGPDDGCACRKPRTALYERAITDLGLDGARSFFVGDRLRDLQPARAFGGGGILVPSADTSTSDVVVAQAEYALSTSIGAAVDRILSSERLRGTGRA
jgi:D-glycero-D-manno-heptose 1,7-bisphosphate phosphatase